MGIWFWRGRVHVGETVWQQVASSRHGGWSSRLRAHVLKYKYKKEEGGGTERGRREGRTDRGKEGGRGREIRGQESTGNG